MGRGGNGENEFDVGGMRATTGSTEITYELQLLHSAGLISEGELLKLSNDQTIELEDGDPALVMRGLAEVETIELQKDGTYLVSFRDGTTALVDLDAGAVAFPDGTESQTLSAGALYAALASRASGAPVEYDDTAAALFSDLAKARAALLDNPGDPDAFRAFAQAAIRAGEQTLPADIQLNPSNLSRRAAGEEPEESSATKRLQAKLGRVRKAMSGALEGPAPHEAPLGVLYSVNEDNKVVLPEEAFAAREEAAKRLSNGADPSTLIPPVKIKLEPELDEDGNPTGQVVSVGEVYLGLDWQAKMQHMRHATDRGQRCFIFRGPPGSGKDTFAEQFAALSRRPFRTYNLGGTTDINSMTGGDAIREQKLYMRNEDGSLVKDEKGEPIHIASIPVTDEQVGDLVKWMKEPSCVVLQEPEGQQADLIKLNSALGDRIGDPTQRYVLVDSATGNVHQVHEDCTVFITHNDREGQEPIPSSTKNRGLNLDFEYQPIEEEAEMLARGVTNALRNAQDSPGLNREYTAEEVMPMALVAQQARRAKEEGEIEDDFGFRQVVTSYCELVQSGYDQDEDPVTSMCEIMTWLYDRNSYTYEERLQMLRDTIIADQHGRLHDIARAAEKVAAEQLGG